MFNVAYKSPVYMWHLRSFPWYLLEGSITSLRKEEEYMLIYVTWIITSSCISGLTLKIMNLCIWRWIWRIPSCFLANIVYFCSTKYVFWCIPAVPLFATLQYVHEFDSPTSLSMWEDCVCNGAVSICIFICPYMPTSCTNSFVDWDWNH